MKRSSLINLCRGGSKFGVNIYILGNIDAEFYYMLVVVVLNDRLIRIYNLLMGTRIKDSRGEIKSWRLCYHFSFMTVLFSIKLNEPTGHHWMLTRTFKLECFWNQTSHLKLNSHKKSCNNNTIACKY